MPKTAEENPENPQSSQYPDGDSKRASLEYVRSIAASASVFEVVA